MNNEYDPERLERAFEKLDIAREKYIEKFYPEGLPKHGPERLERACEKLERLERACEKLERLERACEKLDIAREKYIEKFHSKRDNCTSEELANKKINCVIC